MYYERFSRFSSGDEWYIVKKRLNNILVMIIDNSRNMSYHFHMDTHGALLQVAWNQEKWPVILIAGGADVSPRWPDNLSTKAKVLKALWVLDTVHSAAKFGEKTWNAAWKLDPHANHIWMGKLELYLRETFWEEAEVIHMKWSGSAAPWKEKEAIQELRAQLGKISKEHVGRPIVCICKSLAGPYMVRALHEENGITITQLIALGSPWWRGDTIPDNIHQTTLVTSINDVFQRVWNWARFWNFEEASPRMKSPEKETPLEIVVTHPTHWWLNHDSPTGIVEIHAEDWKIPNALKNVDSMYQLFAAVIQAGLAQPRG